MAQHNPNARHPPVTPKRPCDVIYTCVRPQQAPSKRAKLPTRKKAPPTALQESYKVMKPYLPPYPPYPYDSVNSDSDTSDTRPNSPKAH